MNPVILAHGALGAFDELVFLGIALVFVGMMAVSWYRSQHIILEEDEKPKKDNQDEEAHVQTEAERFELK